MKFDVYDIFIACSILLCNSNIGRTIIALQVFTHPTGHHKITLGEAYEKSMYIIYATA